METIKAIKTPRGTLNIKAIFKSEDEAKVEGFNYYFTNDGIDIYTKHISEYSCYFATVERQKHMTAKQELQEYYDKHDFNVTVEEETKFDGFSVLRCKEWHPMGMPWTYFDIIARDDDDKFYNSNFDDIVALNEMLGFHKK